MCLEPCVVCRYGADNVLSTATTKGVHIMCHESTGDAFDRPLFSDDVPLIAGAYPEIPRTSVDRIFNAITDHHWPQPAVLIAVLELVNRSSRNDYGLYECPTMPFSAMDLETYDRVQTDGMYAFHTVFESMALAQRNMVLLNDVLGEEFGLQLVLFCDCGCGIVPSDETPFETEWYQQINELRSLAEACGTPVVRVQDFASSEWNSRSLDMGPSETSAYDRMYATLSALPARAVSVHDLASVQFAERFQKAA